MRLCESSDDEERILFATVVVHLETCYGYSNAEAVRLVNEFYEKFTDPQFCEKFNIPVQNMDLFGHTGARGMADQVQYYEGLGNFPDDERFIKWQRSLPWTFS